MKKFVSDFKRVIILCGLIGIVGASTLFLGATDVILTEVPEIKTLIGYDQVFQFQDEITKREFEIRVSKQEYESFFRTRIKPIYPDSVFIGASFKPLYSTSVPILEDYQYFIKDRTMASGTSPVLIKLPNLVTKEIEGNYVVDNKLTSMELNELTK